MFFWEKLAGTLGLVSFNAMVCGATAGIVGGAHALGSANVLHDAGSAALKGRAAGAGVGTAVVGVAFIPVVNAALSAGTAAIADSLLEIEKRLQVSGR